MDVADASLVRAETLFTLLSKKAHLPVEKRDEWIGSTQKALELYRQDLEQIRLFCLDVGDGMKH